jgi:hypothetical protein
MLRERKLPVAQQKGKERKRGIEAAWRRIHASPAERFDTQP